MYRILFRRAGVCAVLAALAVSLILTLRTAVAQGPPPARAGSQEVTVAIDDRLGLAVTTIRQSFANDSASACPTSFSLPIPDEAAILRFSVLAPKPKKGETSDSLGGLRPAGRSLYRARVARVPGRGRAAIEVVYADRWPAAAPDASMSTPSCRRRATLRQAASASAGASSVAAGRWG